MTPNEFLVAMRCYYAWVGTEVGLFVEQWTEGTDALQDYPKHSRPR